LVAAFTYANNTQGEVIFPDAGPYLCSQQLQWNRIRVVGRNTEIKFTGLGSQTDCLLLGGSNGAKRLKIESIFINANNVGRDAVVCTGGDNTKNLLQQTQSFNNSAWTQFSLGSVSADTTLAPDGSLSADTITYTANTYADISQPVNTLQPGKTYTLSVWARSVSGSSQFRFKYWNGSAGTYSNNQTLTTTWARYSYTFVASSRQRLTSALPTPQTPQGHWCFGEHS
jgi:hypothetical protein